MVDASIYDFIFEIEGGENVEKVSHHSTRIHLIFTWITTPASVSSFS